MIKMLGMPIAAADSNSDCSAIRLRSLQVSCMIGATPIASVSRLPAQLASRTTALWLSVMLTAATQSRNGCTLRRITSASAPRGGPTSAVTVNAPLARADWNRPGTGSVPRSAAPAGPGLSSWIMWSSSRPLQSGGTDRRGAGQSVILGAQALVPALPVVDPGALTPAPVIDRALQPEEVTAVSRVLGALIRDQPDASSGRVDLAATVLADAATRAVPELLRARHRARIAGDGKDALTAHAAAEHIVLDVLLDDREQAVAPPSRLQPAGQPRLSGVPLQQAMQPVHGTRRNARPHRARRRRGESPGLRNRRVGSRAHPRSLPWRSAAAGGRMRPSRATSATSGRLQHARVAGSGSTFVATTSAAPRCGRKTTPSSSRSSAAGSVPGSASTVPCTSAPASASNSAAISMAARPASRPACSIVPIAPSQISTRWPSAVPISACGGCGGCASASCRSSAGTSFTAAGQRGHPACVARRARSGQDVQPALGGPQDFDRHLRHHPVAIGVKPQTGDLLDPPDAVGDGVGVQIETSCGPLRAVVFPEVTRQSGQQLDTPLRILPIKLT